MAQDGTTLHLHVTVAWWWPLYAQTLKLMFDLGGLEPNPEHVNYWARKAMRFEVVRG